VKGTEEDLVQDQILVIEDGTGHLLEEEEEDSADAADAVDFHQDAHHFGVGLVVDPAVPHQDGEEVHQDE